MFTTPTIRQIKTRLEISPYPYQNGKDQQNKGQQMLRVTSGGKEPSFMVGMTANG